MTAEIWHVQARARNRATFIETTQMLKHFGVQIVESSMRCLENFQVDQRKTRSAFP
jgi:hypothetical protein